MAICMIAAGLLAEPGHSGINRTLAVDEINPLGQSTRSSSIIFLLGRREFVLRNLVPVSKTEQPDIDIGVLKFRQIDTPETEIQARKAI